MARSLKRALAFQKKFRNDIAAHSAFPRLATCAFLLDAPAKISQHCAPRGRTSEVLLPQKAVFNIASLIERQKYFRTQIQRAKPAAPIYAPEKFFRYPPQYPASKFPFQTPREKSLGARKKKTRLRRAPAEAAPRYCELNFSSAYKMFSPSFCNVSMHSASESMSPLFNPKPMLR